MVFVFAPLALAAAVVVPTVKASPQIVVEGVGSVDTPANLASLSYDILGEGKTSDEAVSNLVAKSTSVEHALKAMDPALKLESESMQVEAVRGSNCKDDRYDETLHLSTGECAILGYVAKQDFDVRTSQVADAGTMVGLAGRNGAANPKIDSFQLADQREARRQAIAAALADAKSKAQAIAAGSNAALGDVLTVSLDGAAFRSAEEIVITGSEVQPRVMAPAPVTVVVKPGPVRTTANVTVSYEIRR